MIIDIQFNQGSAPWPQMLEAVHAAEDAGFATLWNLDHFSGEMFGSEAMYECFSTLASWATVTTRIGLGSLVANMMNRTPGMLAHAATTVQHISAGRLILGVGAGSSPTSPYGGEQRALGIEMLPTMAARHQRLVDTVNEVRRIWSAERPEEFAGFPRPTPTPRIIAGINSEGLARLAGEHLDGVNIRFNHERRAELLHRARETSGRDDFDVSVWAWFDPEMADRAHPFVQELAAEGVTRLVLLVRGAPDPDLISGCSRYLG